jgi:signal peptidase II
LLLTFIVAVIVIAADQASKFWVETVLRKTIDIPIWNGVFHFYYMENTGAAFGMLPGFKWVFLALSATAALLIAAFVIYKRRGLHWSLYLPLGMIMGGAVGNMIDRVRLGYVLDFMYFKLINFAIFNVADASLVVGSILMGVYLLFIHERVSKRRSAKKEECGAVLHDGR